MSTHTLIAKPAEARPKPRRKRPVPAALIRETINGIPFYYRGYRDVLNKKQTLDDISATCAIHVLIKKYFYDLLSNALDHSLFTVFVGEIGVQTEPKNQFSLGLAGYEMAQLPGEKFGFGYFDVLPKFVIEIDMKVSLDESGVENFAQFLNLKTQKLFDSGVERLVWVISANKKVVIATPGEDWLIVDWNKDINLWQGVKANIGQHLKKRGINPEVFGKN